MSKNSLKRILRQTPMLNSVKTKILLAQLLLLLLMALLIGLRSHMLLREYLLNVQQDKLISVAQVEAKHLDHLFHDYADQFREIALHDVIEVYAKKFSDQLLQEHFSKFQENFPVLSFVNRSGQEEFKLINGESSEELHYVGESPAFQAAIQSPGEFVSLYIAPGPAQKTPSIQMALSRVTFFDEFIGVLMGSLSLPDFLDRLDSNGPDESGFSMLVDQQRNILSHPDRGFISQTLQGSGEDIEQLMSGMQQLKPAFGRATLMGTDAYVTSVPLQSLPWSLLVLLPYEEYLPVLRSLATITVGSTILLLALVTPLAVYFARTIADPLIKFTALTERVAQSDLSAKLDIRSHNEIGVLAHSFNKMLDQLAARKKEILDAKEYTESILENMSESLIVINLKYRITTVNQATLKLFGYTEGEMLGQPLQMLHLHTIHKGPISRDKSDATPLFECTLPKHQEEISCYAKNGTQIPVLFSSTDMCNDAGESHGIVCVFLDLRARKQAEAQQKQLEEQLRQAQKMEAVGTLAGGIAHDINSLLAVMTGYGFMLSPKFSPDSAEHEYVQELLRAGQRAKDLILRLNSFSRPDIDYIEPIQLSSVVNESLHLLRPSFPTSIDIQLDLECDEQSIIQGDLTQIQQLFTNLCLNARDAMAPTPGTLSISIGTQDIGIEQAQLNNVAPGPYVKLCVEDNGKGIPPEELDQIFNPFFTTKDIGKGTGLGLSVVYGIAKRHHAFIRVESQPGRGSAFSVYFPLALGL